MTPHFRFRAFQLIMEAQLTRFQIFIDANICEIKNILVPQVDFEANSKTRSGGENNECNIKYIKIY